ncbi:hypothetical protein, partial [Anaerovibrio slackiae]|uniref:hypothetical protein n=1 Tax=Anaerovibrio slackiae TaxID=2652309 RepID=UPI003867D27A
VISFQCRTRQVVGCNGASSSCEPNRNVSMPHAASGRLQQHHVGSPMILDLTGTIWREMQNFSIFSILEHVHESEIQQKSTVKASKSKAS